MSSPNPANLPLPLSPDPNPSSSPNTLPLSLPVSEAASSPETESLIASLRTSLSSAQAQISVQATRLSTLADLETQHIQLKDQYAFLSAAKEAVESQLQEEVKKREVAEENVETLRGQVEQARRGVMTLQKQDAERKRMSVLGNGMAGGMGLGLGEEEVLASLANIGEGSQRNESKLYKRQSMMAGRSHRRVSSQSEPGADIHSALLDRPITLAATAQTAVGGNTAPSTGGGTLRPNAVGGGLRELRLGATPPTAAASLSHSPSATTNNPNQSGYFDDQMQPQSALQKLTLNGSPTKNEAAANAAKEEAARLRSELGTVQRRLAESEEARVASELCLKALREFMASNTSSGGDEENPEGMSSSTADLLKGIRLPPLPTDRDANEEHGDTPAGQSAKPSGWGFKLWANKPQPQTSPAKELPTTPS
ncbi:hypothetical protein IAR55_000870 [Kwoniella newhampshirensis]|uniref:GDP/GTP exchange factor Sec2 N-terminal domain-containing protein n=1 Tax=Kwoniella newhampshirensis TaxID=1651941 RepID=A0AAW0Z496_9TREE